MRQLFCRSIAIDVIINIVIITNFVIGAVIILIVTFSTAFEAFSQSTIRQVLRSSIAFSASKHRLIMIIINHSFKYW